MKHFSYILAGLIIALVGVGLLFTHAHSASPDPLRGPGMTGIQGPVFQQPVYNWRVCADLGVGPVPGTGLTRQRFRLCHNQGWTLLAYCLQPSRPAPGLRHDLLAHQFGHVLVRHRHPEPAHVSSAGDAHPYSNRHWHTCAHNHAHLAAQRHTDTQTAAAQGATRRTRLDRMGLAISITPCSSAC